MTDVVLGLVGLAFSTIGGLGLAWGEPLAVLLGNLEARVKSEFRLIYPQIPMGEPSREWQKNRLAELRRGRMRAVFWFVVFLSGIVTSALGIL